VTLHVTGLARCKLVLVSSLLFGFAGGNANGTGSTTAAFKIGDMVRFNSVGPNGAAGMIPVSTSLEDMKAFMARQAEESQVSGSRSIEGMVFVGHNTPANVVKLATSEVPGNGAVEFARVTLAAGGFRGQEVWVLASRLRGAHEPNPTLSPRASIRGKADGKRIEGRKAGLGSPVLSPPERRHDMLVLTDLAANRSPTGKNFVVVGRFRNVSGEDLKTVRVIVTFRDRAGKLIGSERSLCVPKIISPGDAGSFEVNTHSDKRYETATLEFTDSNKSLSWADKTGKGAHP
jgi:hypothetical protein